MMIGCARRIGKVSPVVLSRLPSVARTSIMTGVSAGTTTALRAGSGLSSI
jgi:hypothetical protein